VRSRHRVRTFFASTVTQVNRIFITTALTVAEDEAIRANTFFFNKVVDDRVNPIPAQLLSGLARFAITNNGDLTVYIGADLRSSSRQERLVVLAQRNGMTLEGDAGQVADAAFMSAATSV